MIIFELGTGSVDNLVKNQMNNIFINNFELLKQLFFEMYSVLIYLRLRNMCHRDIKPKDIIYF